MSDVYDKCTDYLNGRSGTYDYRCRRYDAVIDVIEKNSGLDPSITIADLGSGWTEFGHRLTERGFRGRYLPYDGNVDGKDLTDWSPPPTQIDWIVAIEFLEHLDYPTVLVKTMLEKAEVGVVVTTPDSFNVDTLSMDPDHVTALDERHLREMGFINIEKRILFPGSRWSRPGYSDTLVGWTVNHQRKETTDASI